MQSVPDPAPDDDALVRAYQADPAGPNGRAAAAALVERWRRRVYVWAYNVLREREAALDAAQESLTRMYLALPRYEVRGKFSAWLFTIVQNHCRHAVRARPLLRDDDVETDALQSQSPGPAEAFASAESERELFEALQHALEPTERMAIWLRCFEGMSVEDITRVLGIDGASGARSVLQSARRKLRLAMNR